MRKEAVAPAVAPERTTAVPSIGPKRAPAPGHNGEEQTCRAGARVMSATDSCEADDSDMSDAWGGEIEGLRAKGEDACGKQGNACEKIGQSVVERRKRPGGGHRACDALWRESSAANQLWRPGGHYMMTEGMRSAH